MALKYSGDISDFPCTIPRTAVANRLIQDAALVQWLAVIVAVLAPMTAWEAFLGHYRSGFSLKAQYAPLLTATLLTVAAAASLVAPGRSGTALQAAGWIGVATGVIGLGYHHYYGVVEKPGGYNWLLHQLMHHAPPLAPLSQAALGALLICEVDFDIASVGEGEVSLERAQTIMQGADHCDFRFMLKKEKEARQK